jgi:segregation and condensation protein B
VAAGRLEDNADIVSAGVDQIAEGLPDLRLRPGFHLDQARCVAVLIPVVPAHQHAGVIQTLLERRLITTAGRKQVIGRPILYRTSKEFMMRFGLSDLEDLPSLKEFEALAREALGTEDGVAETVPATDSAESVESDESATADSSDVAAAPQSATPESASPSPEPVTAERAESGASEANADAAKPSEKAAGSGTI